MFRVSGDIANGEGGFGFNADVAETHDILEPLGCALAGLGFLTNWVFRRRQM